MLRPTALALTLAPLGVAADAEPAPLTYEAFEVAVPHIDLESCPETLAAEGVFCRATLNLDEIHVFAFEETGESPFVGLASFPADGLTDLLR